LDVTFAIDEAVAAAVAERLFGMSPADVAAAGPERVAAVVAAAALAALAGTADGGEGAIPIDAAAVTAKLAALAGAPRPVESDADVRGVAGAVWSPANTPDAKGSRWTDPGGAPEGYDIVDHHLSKLYDALAGRTGLRLLISDRLLPDDGEYREMLAYDLVEPVRARIHMDDGDYMITIDPSAALLVGPLAFPPEKLRGGR
jgi:hypothetical protein